MVELYTITHLGLTSLVTILPLRRWLIAKDVKVMTEVKVMEFLQYILVGAQVKCGYGEGIQSSVIEHYVLWLWDVL